MADLISIVSKLTAPIARRVRLTVRRAVVKIVYDDPKMQELQLAIFSGEVRDKVERFQEYGFTSNPHPDAEALVAALGGSTDHSVVFTVADRRYRVKQLATGEVAIFDDQDQVILLGRDKTIRVYGTDHLVADVGVDTTLTCPLVTVAAYTKVVLATPLVECSGDMRIGGDLTVAGAAAVTGAVSSAVSVADPNGTMQTMRNTYNGHDHPGDSGGTTGTPNQAM